MQTWQPRKDVQVVDVRPDGGTDFIDYQEQGLSLAVHIGGGKQPLIVPRSSGSLLQSLGIALDKPHGVLPLNPFFTEGEIIYPLSAYVHFNKAPVIILTTADPTEHNVNENTRHSERPMFATFMNLRERTGGVIMNTGIGMFYQTDKSVRAFVSARTRSKTYHEPFYALLSCPDANYEAFQRRLLKHELTSALSLSGAFLYCPPKPTAPCLERMTRLVLALMFGTNGGLPYHIVINQFWSYLPDEMVQVASGFHVEPSHRFPMSHYIIVYVLRGTLHLTAPGLAKIPPAPVGTLLVLASSIYYKIAKPDKPLAVTLTWFV